MLNRYSAGRCVLVSALMLTAFVPFASAKTLKPEQVLYSFCSQANCSDGSHSQASLLMDGSGNLYGTTVEGGANVNEAHCSLGCGTVFKLAPDGTETVLYSFCSQAGCTDGSYPAAGLIEDASGNFYGTTEFGGTGPCTNNSGCGTVFEIAADGTESTLYTFCSAANCTDGANPVGGLVMDGAGNLYGTTELGGTGTACHPGCGTIFEISGGTESVLYSFCSEADCADGEQPEAGLIFDGSGNLYGTTTGGGISTTCCGTVFEYTSGGTENVLHAFSATDEGVYPTASLTMDTSGNLYGTTSDGTVTGVVGAAFELAPDGTETVLHTFTGGSDGGAPLAGVILDSSGNLYGTTSLGGTTGCRKHTGCGTVFKVTPDGTETVLYPFKSQKHGVYPYSGVIADSSGNLYGTAFFGGLVKYGSGVVYKINISATAKTQH